VSALYCTSTISCLSFNELFDGSRYIEGLTSGSRSVGDWEKSLYAKPPDNPSAVPVSDKLPVHWLADGSQENAVSALWALRDHMLKDAITVSRTLDSVSQI